MQEPLASNMQKSLVSTNFNFSNNQTKYQGKVRDVYSFDNTVVMIATDRISAFDVVSTQGIPYKGQVLNQIAAHQLDATKDIIRNWVQTVADPNVTIGERAEVFPIEVIVRGYLVGSAARAYTAGSRDLCGNILAEGMIENQKFETPLLTPTTKAGEGHDQDTTAADIVEQGWANTEEWAKIAETAQKLFARGTELAAAQGLILVDTKYEFGKTKDGEIILVDEIHTPDSSRYFYAEDYQQRVAAGQSPRQLSKEFVREWLMGQGYKGQTPDWPIMPEDFVQQISDRYIELYEKLVGKSFEPADYNGIENRISQNVKGILS